MNNLIYLIFILALTFSCSDKKSPETATASAQTVADSPADTLKFTSGIMAILKDSKGNHWVGSNKEGVCLVKDQTFTYFTREEGLSDNQIRSIREDAQGQIWIGTGNGVTRFDGTSMIQHSPPAFPGIPAQWEKTPYDLWFNAGTREGVYRYDGQNLSYLPFPSPKVINPQNVYSVTGISEGQNNRVWLATYAGVFGYNGRDFIIINDETPELEKELAPLHIRSILEDSKGRLWIGNNGTGVLLKEGDSLINFSRKQHLVHPESGGRGDQSPPGTMEHVFRITEDRQGNIWFGDRDAGVWKYDGKSMTNYTQEDGLSTNFASSIHCDNNGDIWFGLADGKVFTFNGVTFDRQF